MTERIALLHNTLDDNAVIARGLKAQDTDVLDMLIERYQHRMMRYLVYLTGNRHEAEDMFQELWLRVLRSGAGYNGSSSFETWLSAIARNLVVDLRRKRVLVSLEAMESVEENGWRFEVAEDAPTPFDRYRWREAMASFDIALATLQEDQREVVNLRFREGLTLSEIAAATHAPLNTVKARLYRGIAALKSIAMIGLS